MLEVSLIPVLCLFPLVPAIGAGWVTADRRSRGLISAFVAWGIVFLVTWGLWRLYPEARITLGSSREEWTLHAASIVPVIAAIGLFWIWVRKGRGWIYLGTVTTLTSLAAFGVVGTAAVRWEHRYQGLAWRSISASPTGSGFLQSSRCSNVEPADAGILRDGRTGAVVRFLPPGVCGGQWSPDGRIVAVSTNAGLFGSRDRRWRIEWYRPDGSRYAEPFKVPAGSIVGGGAWLGKRFVAALLSEAGGDFITWEARVIRPGEAAGQPLDTSPLPLRTWLVGPGADGRVALVGPRKTRTGDLESVVRWLDPATLHLGDPETVAIPLRLGPWPPSISPSGMYWLVPEFAPGVRPDGRASRIVSTETGAARSGPLGRSAQWLSDDAVLWIDRPDRYGRSDVLERTTAAGGTQEIRRFEGGASIEVSPDRNRALVGFRERHEDNRYCLYDVATKRCDDLRISSDYDFLAWAGPDRVLLVDLKRFRLGFSDLGHLQEPTVIWRY